MITEKIIGKIDENFKTDKKIEYVSVDWFERDKKLLRKTTDSGEDIGIRIGEPLNENDIIYEDENRLVVVTIAPSDLISVSIGSIEEMGRLCFELGNRHLSLAIGHDNVKCPYDEPTFEYLKKLGFNAVKTHEKFTGYTECKGHAHTDAHGNAQHSYEHHEHEHNHGEYHHEHH